MFNDKKIDFRDCDIRIDYKSAEEIIKILYERLDESNKALEKIKDMGFYISIFSCRTSKEVFKHLIDRVEQARKIEEYMEEHNLIFDEILIRDKPVASYYIGDEAIGFRGNWVDTINELEELEKS